MKERQDEERQEEIREENRKARMNAGTEDDENETQRDELGMPKLESWLKAQQTQIDLDRAERAKLCAERRTGDAAGGTTSTP